MARRPLTSSQRHHARRAVVDWASALLPGSIEAPARAIEHALADDLDHGRSRLTLGRLATARAAALINGTAAHTVEVDDIYREAIYHPGAPTISAAWAAAQDVGADGETLLRAVVVGYELSTRIGAALGRAHYRYWHNTGTVGTFGAAAAAARPCTALTASASAMRWPRLRPSLLGCNRPSARIPCPNPCTPAALQKRACSQRNWRERTSPAQPLCC